MQIMLLLAKQVVTQPLQNLEQEEVNRNLLESYLQLMAEYSDHVVETNGQSFFFKFLRQDLFLVFQLETKENSCELLTKTYIICLNCIK